MDTKLELHQHTPSHVAEAENWQIATPADYAICRLVMRKASKNYSSASNFLPADRLPYVEALYAFLRVGDDRVDVSHGDFASPLEAIDDWEYRYWQAFERGDSYHPVMRAYVDTAVRFGIPKEVMAPYFRSMREDLVITRFPTFENLMHYMEGSAIPVGRAMTYILGVRQPWKIEQALPGADALAVAMQLSNFWRDIHEDWQRGRVYVPLEDMQAYGVNETVLAERRINANLANLLEFEFQRTEKYYERARQSVSMLASGRWAVMCALEIYRAILGSLRARRYNVFAGRAGAHWLQKLTLAAKSYWLV